MQFIDKAIVPKAIYYFFIQELYAWGCACILPKSVYGIQNSSFFAAAVMYSWIIQVVNIMTSLG